MKKILLVTIGTIVLLAGTLIALDEYVDSFTLFPDDLEADGGSELNDDRAATKVIPQEREEEPDVLADEGGRGDDNRNGDASDIPTEADGLDMGTVEMPSSLEGAYPANKAHNGNKKLKASKGRFYKINSIVKKKTEKKAKYFGDVHCPAVVENFNDKIAMRFKFSDDKIVKQILFLIIENKIGKYYFKPRTGVNVLEFPHQFKVGTHSMKYGYVLKKDAEKLEVPFYMMECNVFVEKE